MRTAEQIEAQTSEKKSSLKSSSASPTKKRTQTNPRSLANLIAPWKPGQSGNPGGRPKHDVAQEIAEAIFTGNKELIYKSFSGALRKGSPYAFQVLSDRAFGKLKETKEITHRYDDVPDSDLERRCTELLRDLGLAAQIDAVGGTEGTTAGATEAVEQAQAGNVLP